ncbi:ribosome assembly RNA-binding protein YhbY [Ignatzschineria sp. LJL83]
MTQIKLTTEHIKFLKGKAHHLDPILILGDKGVTESFIKEANNALSHHELIKIKLKGYDRDQRESITTELVTALNATLVQKIGGMIVLFKRNHEEPKIFFNFK